MLPQRKVRRVIVRTLTLYFLVGSHISPHQHQARSSRHFRITPTLTLPDVTPTALDPSTTTAAAAATAESDVGDSPPGSMGDAVRVHRGEVAKVTLLKWTWGIILGELSQTGGNDAWQRDAKATATATTTSSKSDRVEGPGQTLSDATVNFLIDRWVSLPAIDAVKYCAVQHCPQPQLISHRPSWLRGCLLSSAWDFRCILPASCSRVAACGILQPTPPAHIVFAVVWPIDLACP
jgi:hypothetical protein